jgi:hypothetical protein
MAKRRQRKNSGTTLVDLAKQLADLTAQRLAVVARIQEAASALGADSVSIDSIVRGRASKKTTGRRPGFKMSAEARKKISIAAKKRWAAKKAAEKK